LGDARTHAGVARWANSGEPPSRACIVR